MCDKEVLEEGITRCNNACAVKIRKISSNYTCLLSKVKLAIVYEVHQGCSIAQVQLLKNIVAVNLDCFDGDVEYFSNFPGGVAFFDK